MSCAKCEHAVSVRPYPMCERRGCTTEAVTDRVGVMLCADHAPYDRMYLPRFIGGIFTAIVVRAVADYEHLRFYQHGQLRGTLNLLAGQGAELCSALHMREHGHEPDHTQPESETPF